MTSFDFGPCTCSGIDLGQCDGRVQALALGQAERVQVRVAVGEAEPERVLVTAQQHRVVDDAAVGGGDQDVLALADRARGQVAAGDHVGQLEAVRAADLDHALDADVPDRDVVQQRPVLLDRVVVVPGQVHVVVDVVGGAARLSQGRLEERRLPVPGSEVQRGRCFGGRRLTQSGPPLAPPAHAEGSQLQRLNGGSNFRTNHARPDRPLTSGRSPTVVPCRRVRRSAAGEKVACPSLHLCPLALSPRECWRLGSFASSHSVRSTTSATSRHGPRAWTTSGVRRAGLQVRVGPGK